MYQPSNYLPKSALVDGEYYRGTCRNADVARWCLLKNGAGVFLYLRSKFGETFIDEIRHPEDDRHFDVFYPLEPVLPANGQRVSDEYWRRVKEWQPPQAS